MNPFDLIVVQPMLNFLLWLYGVFGNNFILAILVFTLLTRLLVLPLTIQQQRNTQRMQTLQPQFQEIQTKYKSDPQKMNEELQKIGYGPGMLFGGCLPLLAQLVILWGLWQAISRVLAVSPLQLLDLVQSTYTWLPNVVRLIPVEHTWLWLDLGHRDPTYLLPLLVAASTYFSQKAFTPGVPSDAQSAAMTRQMQTIMPVMLGFMSLNFPSALSIYWVISNVLAMVQYYALQRTGIVPAPAAAPARATSARATSGAGGGSASPPAPPPPVSTSKPVSKARKIRSKVK